MFTGLIEHLGEIANLEPREPGLRLSVQAGVLVQDAGIGDSIAVNGCCLTVVAVEQDRLGFDAGPETLQRTNLGQLGIGDHVNLERSLALGDRMGGHFVTGHIDATGTLIRREDDRDWSTFWFRVPRAISAQLASKGSVAVDGVSLTLVEVTDETFSVALIPHTLEVTTLGNLKPQDSARTGDTVNIETDLLAKYVQRQLLGQADDE